MKGLVIAGTNTGVGKTTAAAMLTLALDGIYWKPIQAGQAHGTDTKTVAALTGLGPSHFRPERHVLSRELSPHLAAEIDGVEIRLEDFALPEDIPDKTTLIVETAGGVLVPINRTNLQCDLIARMNAPVVLCARTGLGTINHSLLSIEALRQRNIPLLGILFVGEEMEDSEQTIAAMGKVRRLGRLPVLDRPDRESLLRAFEDGFDKTDFEVDSGAGHGG